LSNRVHRAKSLLSKARLVEPTRHAHFRITSRGQKVLSKAPERIDNRLLSQFPEFRAFREGYEATAADHVSALPVEEDRLTPDEVMRKAARELETALAGELLQKVLAGTPAFFESIVVRLLIAIGYGGSVNDLDKALVGKSGTAA
jgi:restriction system protein